MKPGLTALSSTDRHHRAMPYVGLLAAGTVVAAALVDGSAWHRTDPVVLAHLASSATTLASQPWRLITSLIVTSGPRMTLTVALGLLASLTAAQWRLGPRRAVLAALAGSLVATVACDLALLAGSAAGSSAAARAARAPDFGASGLSAGAAGALARSVRPVPAALIAVATLNGLALNHTLADWEHLVAFFVGWLLPTTTWAPRSSLRPSWPASAA